MAVVTNPILSETGRNSLASAVTYYNCRGLLCARQRVIPANPRTLDQQLNRLSWLFSLRLAQLLGKPFQAEWTDAATERAQGDTWLSRATGACAVTYGLATQTDIGGRQCTFIIDPVTQGQYYEPTLSDGTVCQALAGGGWSAPIPLVWRPHWISYFFMPTEPTPCILRFFESGQLIGIGEYT